MACPVCGHGVLPVEKDMYKCRFCETYLKEKNGVFVPYSHTVTPYDDEVRKRMVVTGIAKPREAQVKEVEGVFSLTDLQLKWVNGVAARLIPIREGEGANVTELRNKYRQGLIDVFKGKLTMDDWIIKTGVERGMKEVVLLKVLERELSKQPEIRYNREAQEMRKQFRQRISMLAG